MNSVEFLDESYLDLRLSNGEDVVILACVVLIQYHSVTDRQTDMQITAITAFCNLHIYAMFLSVET